MNIIHILVLLLFIIYYYLLLYIIYYYNYIINHLTNFTDLSPIKSYYEGTDPSQGQIRFLG
jgi:hypothetical protein